MNESSFQNEINPLKQEEESVQKVMEKLTTQQKIAIVVQSFMVGAGFIDAHNMYVLYLSKQFHLTPREGGILLRQCFVTLNESEKRRVLQAAYRQHLDTMKKNVRTEKKRHERQTAEAIGNFQAAIQAVESNLPVILRNTAFDSITTEEQEAIAQLPLEFTPSVESDVVKKLTEICDAHGYYKK